MRKIIILALIGFVGCSVRVGPKFNVNTLTPATNDSAIVYFYCPKHSPPTKLRFPVIANDVKIGALVQGGYFKQVMLPGDYNIHSHTRGVIDRVAVFTFEAGKTYFVRLYIERGFYVSSMRFTNVHKDDAIPEIKKTGLYGESKKKYTPQDTVNSLDEAEYEYYSPQDSFDEGEDEYYSPQDSEN